MTFSISLISRTPKDDVKRNEDSSSGAWRSVCRSLRRILSRYLLVLTLVSALLGICVGLLLRLRSRPYSIHELVNLRFPGELLMNMLYFLTLPLIVSSIVSGLTSIDTWALGKISMRAAVYYLGTALLAASLGVVLAVTICPSRIRDKSLRKSGLSEISAIDAVFSLLRQAFPENMVEATFERTLTVLEAKKVAPTATSSLLFPENAVNSNTTITEESVLIPVVKTERGINIMGVIMMSIAVGIVISRLKGKALALKLFFDAAHEVTLILVRIVIWCSPVGVFFLVMVDVVSVGNPWQTFRQTGYFMTVLAGLAAYSLLVLPAVYFFICLRNPYRYMKQVLQALLTAVATSSSLATLPVTMRNLEENNGVDPRVISFVASVGATFSMGGTTLYEAFAVMFIARVEGVDLDFTKVITIGLTSIAAAIAAAGVPQAGLSTMLMVMSSLGIPSNRMGIILPMDWLLDRFRTVTNVLGDVYGAGIVYQLSKQDLELMDQESSASSESNAGTGSALANQMGV